MFTVMLDSNAYDQLIDNLALREAVLESVSAGNLCILGTHVQRDELAATAARDDKRAAELLQCFDELATVVATDVFVLGHSRLGSATLGPSAGSEDEFDTVLRTPAANRADGLPGHTPDAIIIQTALAYEVPLVTAETSGRMAKSAPRIGVQVMPISEFSAQFHK